MGTAACGLGMDGAACGCGAGGAGVWGAGWAGAAGSLLVGALAAVGIWPWKMRRKMPGASIDKGLVLILGCSILPVME